MCIRDREGTVLVVGLVVALDLVFDADAHLSGFIHAGLVGDDHARAHQGGEMCIRDRGCTAQLVGKLDNLAWLLNLRAMDIECTPYAMAYCYVTPNRAVPVSYTHLMLVLVIIIVMIVVVAAAAMVIMIVLVVVVVMMLVLILVVVIVIVVMMMAAAAPVSYTHLSCWPRYRLYASSMNKTPPSALSMTLLVSGAVWPV